MKATLIDTMGNDLKVVNAARVSFAKQHQEFDGQRDAKLIQYLAKHNHWTPFAHCQATFHVKAPIFVARQLVKHQIGLVWNEVSRRYVDDTPEFWWPSEWRLRAANKKQGSSDEVVPFDFVYQQYGTEKLDFGIMCRSFEKDATRLYKALLEKEVAPEMARIVLPVNMYTEWHWTGSLMAFARVCKLRLDPHAQKEVQYIAEDISKELQMKFPISWAALMMYPEAKE